MAKDDKSGSKSPATAAFLKSLAGSAKPEIREVGGFAGDWIASRWGDKLNQPGWNLLERIAGLVNETLEHAGGAKHPYFNVVTTIAADVMEQTTPRIWGDSRTRTGFSRGDISSTTRSSQQARTPVSSLLDGLFLDSIEESIAVVFLEAVEALASIPDGLSDADRETAVNDARADFNRKLDKIAYEREFFDVASERLNSVLSSEQSMEWPPYHPDTYSRDELLEIADLMKSEIRAAGYKIIKSMTKEEICEVFDKVRGIVHKEPIDFGKKLRDGIVVTKRVSKEAAKQVDTTAGKAAGKIDKLNDQLKRKPWVRS